MYELKIIISEKTDIESQLKEIKNTINKENDLKANIYFSSLNKHYELYPDIYSEDNKLQSLKVGETTFKGLYDLSLYEEFTLKGYTEEVILNSKDGTIKIPVKDTFLGKNYTVFINVKDSLVAEIRVENKQADSFEIVAYNSEGFVEFDQKMDCSQNNITIEYVIVFE